MRRGPLTPRGWCALAAVFAVLFLARAALAPAPEAILSPWSLIR